MNTEKTYISVSTAVFVMGIFFAAMLFMVPFAHAQEFGDGVDSGCCDFTNTFTPSSDYVNTFTPAPNYVTTATPNYDYITTATPSYDYVTTATPNYDYITTATPYDSYTPSYYSSWYPSSYYTTPSCSSCGGSSFAVSLGALPRLSVLPTLSPIVSPSLVTPGNTTISNNGNTTACTLPNSCSTTVDDHSIFNAPTTIGPTTISSPTTVTITGNNTSPAPSYAAAPVYYPTPTPVYYPQMQQPTCYMYVTRGGNYNYGYGNSSMLYWSSSNATSGYISGIGTVGASGSIVVPSNQYTNYTGTFYGQGGSTTCYAQANYQAPAVYQNPAPYVSLSQVPYTGLDLGPVGTTVYWAFLILWCALAAYLIAVKKIHYRIAARLHAILFGTSDVPSHPAYARHDATPAVVAQTPAPTNDKIDSFIMDQINRRSA